MIQSPFKAGFFAGNRAKLLENLPENAVVVLAAHRYMQQAADASFPFWQEPNFFYLTGLNEPDWRLIIDKAKNQTRLVAPHLSLTKIAFDGILSAEEAVEISGVDRVMNQRQYQDWLKKVAVSGQPVYTLLPQTRLGRYMKIALNPAQRLLVRQLREYGATAYDCRAHLSRLRAIKQKPEIAAIQSAINITTDSLIALFENLGSFRYEYEIEAFLSHEFRRRGAAGHAFAPVIANGKNACTLHYVKNNSRLRKNNWVLIDVGARTHGYAADLTRTVPIGTSSKRLQEVVSAAEEVHNKAIDLLRPGLKTADYIKSVDQAMLDALKNLGLIKRRNLREMRKYFPHSIGHGLGIDVHDSLGRLDTFQEGMVVTVEPGIYVSEREFGVRLENDILITKNGNRNLSDNLPNRFEK